MTKAEAKWPRKREPFEIHPRRGMAIRHPIFLKIRPGLVPATPGWGSWMGQGSPPMGAKEARAAWYSSGELMSMRGIAVAVSTTWVSARWRWRTARRP
jgi:hypothetical protein